MNPARADSGPVFSSRKRAPHQFNHRVRAAVTPALDAVILKAMSRTPTERYATMSAFRDAIDTASITP